MKKCKIHKESTLAGWHKKELVERVMQLEQEVERNARTNIDVKWLDDVIKEYEHIKHISRNSRQYELESLNLLKSIIKRFREIR